MESSELLSNSALLVNNQSVINNNIIRLLNEQQRTNELLEQLLEAIEDLADQDDE
jgi:hypothetical protein